MAKVEISTKRLAISKANAQIVGIVAAASFVTVFCLVAAKTVWTQNQYQGRVIKAKEKAHHQLQDTIKAFGQLSIQYKALTGKSPNIIGGNKDGSGDNDGDNAKIVLDALPSKYDFPALTSSLEKVLADRSIKASSITGTDDQLNQQNNASSPTPEAVSIPFSFTISNTNTGAITTVLNALHSSIRPVQVDTIVLTGGGSDMTLTVTAHTYYQPAKSVKITKQVVK